MIGTCPAADLAPLEYRYALDAVIALVSDQSGLMIRCQAPELIPDIQQRFPAALERQEGRAAVWIEPQLGDWMIELDRLLQLLPTAGPLLIIASLPLARVIPERRGWQGNPLGMHVQGLWRLRGALHRQGRHVERRYGMHSIGSMLFQRLSSLAARGGRPASADRLHFAGRLRYCSQGHLSYLATVGLWHITGSDHGPR